MAMPSEPDDWELRKGQIVGLGERSFRKSYYPQLRQNLDRLQRFRLLTNIGRQHARHARGTEWDRNQEQGAHAHKMRTPSCLNKSHSAMSGSPISALGSSPCMRAIRAMPSPSDLALPAHW